MASRQLTLAKLSRPRLHDVLPRERLFTRLDQAAAHPVVWLAAQPGAGKTTLVASYLQARKRPGIWYQVDAADADPASFIYHLGLAVRGLGDAGAADDLPLLTPEYLADLPGFARRCFRALFERLEPEASLVFDNLQEAADDAALHRLLAAGLAEVPEGVGVFVLSHGEPPAAYATLVGRSTIALLDGSSLRFSLEETQAIAHRRGVDDEAVVESLQSRCHGWAAGLTLLLARRATATTAGDDDDSESLQHVFGYFAQRVFDAASPPQQRALMQLAFLPQVSVDVAEQLTGLPDVERLLDSFYRRHLFVERRRVAADGAGAASAPAQVYQFHGLFRAFLKHRAQTQCSVDQLRELAARAGGLLQAAGHWEAALDLLADAGEWATYGALLRRQAERLLEQGRRQTVLDRLARVPAVVQDRDAWLGYWAGRARGPVQAEAALKSLRAAFHRFERDGDAAGQLACGAALVQVLWHARLGWSEIAPWVDRLEPLIAQQLRFESPTMELYSVSALHAALTFCRLGHPELRGMALRLLDLVDDDTLHWNQRLVTATHLITYLHNAAEHDLATRLIGRVDARVESEPASALSRAFWHVFRAIHDVRLANEQAATTRFERAEALAREDGLVHAEFAAIQFHAYFDILLRRDELARARLARLELHPARGHADAEMNLAMLRTLQAQRDGDRAAALSHAQRALQAVERVGAAYFQAVFPAMLCSAFADAGQPDTARRILADAARVIAGTYLEVMRTQLLLEQAYVDLVEGDMAAAQARLAQGLALAATDRARAAYAHRIVARKPELLVAALKAGIEVDVVRRLIRTWRIAPPDEDVPAWPWPIRVRTLGAFEVRVDDEPIVFGRKAPKKTLALLKAIIARGGSAPEAALLDTFWPDEEGDAAARSLGAAVHRLRGLLGDGDALVQQGGRLSLDRARVWVDAWAFERALSAGGATAADGLSLYQGAFLTEEEGEAWPVALRERLRARFIQAVGEQGTRLEADGHDEQAIALYLRGLDADNVVEPFYQGLMRCYHRLDRLPEAVSAYRRLKQTLSVTLSLPPSAGTERLYRSLRLG